MKLQRLYSYTRKAIDDYKMINEGDKIAIGISGGKDSLTLLYALAGLKKFYSKPFEICAIQVDLGYADMDTLRIEELCNDLDVEYTLVNTSISEIVEAKVKDSSPCSLCAKLRKGALNTEAINRGCNKIAYAHHKDDLIETMMMSIIYEGRFYAFPPVTHLDKSNLKVIRPLMYVSEKEVNGFKNIMNLPVVKNTCPYDGNTKREYVKNLIGKINYENPGSKDRMFNAIIKGNIEDWVIFDENGEIINDKM